MSSGWTTWKAPELSSGPTPTYANVSHVSHTPFDIRLTFSLLRAPLEEGSSPGGAVAVDVPLMSVQPTAVAEIVMPPEGVEALIDVLRDELDRYRDEVARPAATGARP
jgi:hypothetical protein